METDDEECRVKGQLHFELDNGALSKGGEVDYKHPFRLGLFYHKFVEGFLLSFVVNPILTYPFFGRYLNIPGNMFNAIDSLIGFIWSLRIFWALLSDSYPICGSYRTSYIGIGWALAAIGFIICYFIPLPQPYFGVTNDCKQNTTDILNPDAPKGVLPYVVIILIILFFFGMSNVASDGLTVVYARREAEAKRGKTTTYCSVSEIAGIAIISIITSTLLNSGEYGGNFCFSITYNQYLLGYGAVAIFGVVNAILFTVEPPTEKKQSLRKNLLQFWDLMSTECFLRVAFFILLNTIFQGIKSSGTIKIISIWVKISPFVGGIVAMACISTLIISMIIYERCFISLNWRYVITACNAIIFPLGFFSDCLAIFNVVRNPFVNFLDDVVISIPRAANKFIGLQLATEITEEGNEGIAFALMMTLSGFGAPIATMLSNLMSAPFDVAQDFRYIRDSFDDRLNVFYSVFLSYSFNCFALIFAYTLLPKQKKHVREIKKNGRRYKKTRCLFFIVVIVGVVISNLSNALAVFPSTSCLVIAGGNGCNKLKNSTNFK